MDLLELLRWMINGALDLFLHGVYSGLASLLGFYLTSWGIRFLYFSLATLLRSPTSMPTALVRSTRRLSWSAALFASVSAHCWWDRLLGPF
jgi:hypothetical protein